jgi:hypothetical protein
MRGGAPPKCWWKENDFVSCGAVRHTTTWCAEKLRPQNNFRTMKAQDIIVTGGNEMDDPLEMVEQKYHLFVLAGYAVVVAIIVSVLHASVLEHLVLWLIGVVFFGAVLSRIRKGVEPAPKFEV